jgi:hypothetical protein
MIELRNICAFPTDTPTGAFPPGPTHHACAHEIVSFAVVDFGHNITLIELVNYDTN